MESDTQPPTDAQRVRIRELNDQLRMMLVSRQARPEGRMQIVLTQGVSALPADVQVAAFGAVGNYSAWDADNCEHDFGAPEVCGHKLFFKIDYYAPGMEFGSEDPADPRKTVRVLTIMLASEY